MMKRTTTLLLSFALATPGLSVARAKKPGAPATPQKQASAQTSRAMSELAGKFKWDISSDAAMKLVGEDIAARFDDRIKKEVIPYKQDKLLKEKAEALAKMTDSYVKFDGQKTGWDVSLVDHEFVHKNDESMLVIWEEKQRRFLFFHQDKLWKQFIAFNAENQIFRDKTFDDFADLIQKRYGPAAVIFKKKKTTDEQAFDHLEWPPSGDYVLWAIDLTTFYGNYCLALMKTSAVPVIERTRAANNPKGVKTNELVDSAMKSDSDQGRDANSDVVDDITGHVSRREEPASDPAKGDKKKDKKDKAAPEKPAKPAEKYNHDDPLDGMKL